MPCHRPMSYRDSIPKIMEQNTRSTDASARIGENAKDSGNEQQSALRNVNGRENARKKRSGRKIKSRMT